MNSYTSIYIPRMSIYHTEETIRNIMSHYRIGTVSYIDFTPINKKPGFGENVDGVVKSAFVHFSDPCLCDDEQYHYRSRITFGNDDFWDSIQQEIPYKLQIRDGEYWICLKNKNPVKRTLMNVHQVVESGRHLENLVEEQAKKIRNLEEKIENMDSVIRQFIGGLFCHDSQKGIAETHRDVLDGNAFVIKSRPENTHKWDCFPTTRQGDETEKRVEILEKIMFEMQVDSLKKNNSEPNDSERCCYDDEHVHYYECHHNSECDDESTICSDIIDEEERQRLNDEYIELERRCEEEEQMHERIQMAKQEKYADKIQKEERWARRQK